MSGVKVLLTGGSGKLGRVFVRLRVWDGLLAPSHQDFDVTNREIIREYLREHRPEVIIHSAARVRMIEWIDSKVKVEGVETNIIGTANLVCEVLRLIDDKYNPRFVYISTDAVYSGDRGNFVETDSTIPYNDYGWTKLGGECSVNLLPNACIVRTSFFDPENIRFDDSPIDMYSSKLPVSDLVRAVKEIAESNFVGTLNVGQTRKSEYERYVAYKTQLKKTTFASITENMPIRIAKDASLDVSKWKGLNEHEED